MQSSNLKITDMQVFDLDGLPKKITLIKIFTNSGVVGYGELRDASSRNYATMLKSRILGENPLNIDKIFRKIRQFGNHSRQGGGVSGVEVALMDIAGKYWNVPCWQLMGGKYRDAIRIYCDTDVDAGAGDGGMSMGRALKKRMSDGFTMLKMDLGIGLLMNMPGMLNAPLGLLDEMKQYASYTTDVPHGSAQLSDLRWKAYDLNTMEHPFTGIHITEKGMDYLENYVQTVRSGIGYDIPLAIDHFGHVCAEDCIRFALRVEKYNPAWFEDPVPWQYTDQYRMIRERTSIPLCTGEDIYGLDAFKGLIDHHAISIAHPDVLTAGGMRETKRIGDYAYEHGVAVALHMAESPVGAMAAVHVGAALPQLLAMEFHSADTADWQDIVTGLPMPLIQGGFIQVPDKPGLGIDSLVEDELVRHANAAYPAEWLDTRAWDNEICNDRQWS